MFRTEHVLKCYCCFENKAWAFVVFHLKMFPVIKTKQVSLFDNTVSNSKIYAILLFPLNSALNTCLFWGSSECSKKNKKTQRVWRLQINNSDTQSQSDCKRELMSTCQHFFFFFVCVAKKDNTVAASCLLWSCHSYADCTVGDTSPRSMLLGSSLGCTA